MFFNWQLKNASSTVCQNCLSNCKTCGSAGTCVQCNTGYYWTISANVGQCVACSSLCLTCTNNTHCTQCSSNSYLNTLTVHIQT
jgi:hypothetical protein